MTRNLVLIIIASVLLSIILAVVCHLAFWDILPYSVGEDETVSWRRQLAFLITTAAWFSAESAGLFTIVLGVHLWQRRSLRQT